MVQWTIGPPLRTRPSNSRSKTPTQEPNPQPRRTAENIDRSVHPENHETEQPESNQQTHRLQTHTHKLTGSDAKTIVAPAQKRQGHSRNPHSQAKNVPQPTAQTSRHERDDRMQSDTSPTIHRYGPAKSQVRTPTVSSGVSARSNGHSKTNAKRKRRNRRAPTHVQSTQTELP